jgi:hypothetical protein
MILDLKQTKQLRAILRITAPQTQSTWSQSRINDCNLSFAGVSLDAPMLKCRCRQCRLCCNAYELQVPTPMLQIFSNDPLPPAAEAFGIFSRATMVVGLHGPCLTEATQSTSTTASLALGCRSCVYMCVYARVRVHRRPLASPGFLEPPGNNCADYALENTWSKRS